VFSLVNRLRARTSQGPEAFSWEPVRFTMSGGYDFKVGDRPVAPLRAELILNPGRYIYFRGDTSYGIYKGEGFLSGNTDLGLTLPRFAATLGTRFTKGGANLGSTTLDSTTAASTNVTNGSLPSTNFVQGTMRADLNRYLSANFSTAWDLRTDTFVENRVGLGIRFQCWALDFAYITRSKEQGLSASDNEFRFSLYLLGVGGPFGVGQRFTGPTPASVPAR
jgi:lipopolysaccharide assembly outer membrane protein LptD (OstA)